MKRLICDGNLAVNSHDPHDPGWRFNHPNITVEVWVGHDEKKPLGRGETGAVAALPIWIDFMKAYIDTRADRKNPPQFEAPGNIVFATLASGITEAFINGTQPQGMAVTPAPVASAAVTPVSQ